jgi:hypothetical protein
MSGVYNRKLFRQSGARDELRKMGGIMSSSEELMREALMTGMQAPGPADLGPMAMPRQQPMGMPAPPVMQPPQPMMQQPMMQQPMMQQPMAPMPMGMGMMQPQQQPMMQPQQPMAEPAFMPPGMPQSLQMQPAQSPGFFLGGLINLAPTMGSSGGTEEAPAAPSPRPNPARAAGIGASTVTPVDITKLAGTAVEPPKVSPDALATAEKLAGEVDGKDPNEVADEILTAAQKEGAETTGDKRFDLASILESMTGDPAAYEKDIDSLNRGIIGAAIAAGTSARATENIARGMLVGLEGAKATEERRAGDARALQLKALEVRAAEQAAREAEIKAGERAKAEAEAKLAEDKRRAYFDSFSSVMELGIDGVDLPVLTDADGNPMIDAEGKPQRMTLEDYARKVAEEQVEIGFPSDAAEVDVEAVLDEARKAITAGRDPAVISDRLKSMGIDPGLL